MKRAALYLRVSTGEQTTENQRLALVAEAERRGWQIVQEYEDAGISGAKGRDKRPSLDRMLKDAARGKFDVAMCWALDRLGRSLADLIATLQTLESASVDLYIQQQAIDTTAPAGKLFFHMLGAFAEFERDMLRQRINAGIARARSRGKHLGRPKLKPEVVARIRQALATGKGILTTAKALGVGTSSVQNVRNAMRSESAIDIPTAPSSIAPGPSAPN